VGELGQLIDRARGGDVAAYNQVISLFQDMAYGYAYSLLGDRHHAEDATQDAFVEAYLQLESLRDPAAFPGWFRRIVRKRCDRIMRARRLSTASLESVPAVPSADPGPPEIATTQEMRETVMAAVRSLPEKQRTATTLFYINGYSVRDIAQFLEVPAGAVRRRLHDSRQKLKDRMTRTVAEELHSSKPGRDFASIARKPSFRVVGVELSDAGAVPYLILYSWVALCARLRRVKAKVDPHILYGVWYRKPGAEVASYVVGVEVAESGEPPDGMVAYTVPESTYVVVRHKGSIGRISATYESIWKWMAETRSEHHEAATFEVYDTTQPLSDDYEVPIYEPIKAGGEGGVGRPANT
jgi:RNA polymerase sigma factor (sigma-70 family)